MVTTVQYAATKLMYSTECATCSNQHVQSLHIMLHDCRRDSDQQVNGDSGASIRTWARKLDSTRDPAAAVRKAEEEEKQRVQQRAREEEQARLQAQEAEQARVRAEEEELARRRAEEQQQARVRAEEEQKARRRAEEEQLARRRAEEEQVARRRAEEEQQARRRAEEEQQARRQAEQEQQARRRAEEEQQLVRSCLSLVIVACTVCTHQATIGHIDRSPGPGHYSRQAARGCFVQAAVFAACSELHS